MIELRWPQPVLVGREHVTHAVGLCRCGKPVQWVAAIRTGRRVGTPHWNVALFHEAPYDWRVLNQPRLADLEESHALGIVSNCIRFKQACPGNPSGHLRMSDPDVSDLADRLRADLAALALEHPFAVEMLRQGKLVAHR